MTTLSNALRASVSSLNVAQQAISISSNNVANADTPGYVTQRMGQIAVVTGGVSQGVKVSSISADVDVQLLKAIQAQSSELGYSNALNDFFNAAQTLLGNPNEKSSISSKIDEFLSAFQILSGNPETASLRSNAVNSATSLANKLSDTAEELYKLQFSADTEINDAVTQVNSLIQSLYDTNTRIVGFQEGTSGRLEVQQNRDLLLRKLSEYVNISTNVDSDGILTVLTGSGVSLLESAGPYHVSHIPASSVDNFINNTSRPAITVAPIKEDGSLGLPVNLVSSGVGANVTTSLSSGSIKGFLELRDVEIPKIIAQLDNLAAEIAKQANAITNDGSSFPPKESLTGTTTVTSTTSLGFSGEVRIAVLNSDGSPILSPYSDEYALRPLTLDLAKLDSGNGAGKPDIQTIIDEINYYYGAPQPRASVGNLQDITLAAVSNNITDGGTAQFDLQLDNISALDSTVVISSITVIDPIDSTQTYTAATLPSPNSYVINAGDRERTNIPFTVNFGGDDNRSSYTVRVRVQVTDAAGAVSVADIDYNVSDNVTNVKNDRYPPVAVANISGTSALNAAPSSQGYLTASIVDANGVAVANGAEGFLKLTTNSNFDYGVAVSELNSKEVGLPSTPSANVTNKGFGNYFGLNNLFVTNSTKAGSALNMKVRDDIIKNPSNIQIGSLILSNQPDDSTKASYTYELGSGDNSIVSRLASLGDIDVSFPSAGTLPSIKTTLSGYSSDIIGYTATISLRYQNIKQTEELGFEGLNQLLQKSSGVNVDNELAKIIELENNYRASAKIISIIQDLFRTLQQSF